MPFHVMSALISIRRLTYFYENMSDRYGRQLKSPKPKSLEALIMTLYPQASTKSFPFFLVTFTNLSIIFKLQQRKCKGTAQKLS